MIRIGCRHQQHGVRWWLFEGFQQAVLRLLSHAFGIGQQRHPERRHERLQTQELLQGLLVRGRAALRMKSDLVDADRLRPVIRPEVRMDLETRWLPRSQEQLLGERARDGRLADRFLAGEAVRVR